MKTSEFARKALTFWLEGYSPFMCDCIHEMSRRIEDDYEGPAAKKLISLIQDAGLSGFSLRHKFQDDEEGLAEFRKDFLVKAIKHFESIDD